MRYLASCALLLVGCVAAETTSTTTQGLEAKNKLVANKLVANKLVANKLVANKLVANKLVANQLAINPIGAGGLLSSADGREVLSYVVSCALPAPQTVVAENQGTCSVDTDCQDLPQELGNTTFGGACAANHTCTYSFFGVIGVTPDWVDHPLDTAGKHWLSACLFSRVNAHDTAEEISLRGENSALTVSSDEQLLYSVEEGAFWGNLFTGDNKPILWNACTGRDLAQGVSGGLTIRDCAKPDPANPGFTKCGFNYAGDCAAFNPALPKAPHACLEFETRAGYAYYYEGCHVPGPHALAKAHDGDDDGDDGENKYERFDEVVTTFVAP
jgi:hypothetical protein